MFEQAIAEQANSPDALARGIKLATSGQVAGMEAADEGGGTVRVQADLRGSGNHVYAAELLLDPVSETVLEHRCTCPEGASQPGLCAHAVAVALFFGLTWHGASAEGEAEEPEPGMSTEAEKPEPGYSNGVEAGSLKEMCGEASDTSVTPSPRHAAEAELPRAAEAAVSPGSVPDPSLAAKDQAGNLEPTADAGVAWEASDTTNQTAASPYEATIEGRPIVPSSGETTCDPTNVEPAFTFRIGEYDGTVSCHATVDYNGETVGLFDDAHPRGPVRDPEKETPAQRAVRALFPCGDTDTPCYDTRPDDEDRVFGASGVEVVEPYFPKKDDAAYYALFSNGLGTLARLGQVLLSERLKKVRAVTPPRIDLHADAAGGSLRLSADASELTDEQLASYLAAYRRKQRYVRLGDDDIMALSGSVAQVADMAESLGVDPEQLLQGGVELPANRALFVDALVAQAPDLGLSASERFQAILDRFDAVSSDRIPVPNGLRARLRPYQVQGYRWLCTLGDSGFGGILADDMGLGKTLQTIAYLCHVKERGSMASAPEPAASADGWTETTREPAAARWSVPAREPGTLALVVCPASLVYNWMAELQRFAPHLRAVAVLGPKEQRRALIGQAVKANVLVTSYDLLKRDIEQYAPRRFSTVVLDEAQYIKNPGTQAAHAAKRLTADARFALTGTPIENRLSELWSIFDFLMPGVLGSADEFTQRYADPIADGDETATERLQSLVGPFILRRLKRDVLADLPEKNESIVYARMTGEQDKLYHAAASKLARSLSEQPPEEFAGSRMQVLAQLTLLRQIACDPHLAYENYSGGSAKLDTCCELVGNALDGGHRILLFSQFTSMFDLIEERLQAMGATYLQLTGSTPKAERNRLVQRFQAGEADVFLISLKAGGVGLNLTAADIVIHYDPWWNLAAQNQATDRAHRIGQERTVSVFKLIAKGTIEEGIARMQERKQGLADAVMSGASVGSTALTRDDVLALLDAQ